MRPYFKFFFALSTILQQNYDPFWLHFEMKLFIIQLTFLSFLTFESSQAVKCRASNLCPKDSCLLTIGLDSNGFCPENLDLTRFDFQCNFENEEKCGICLKFSKRRIYKTFLNPEYEPKCKCGKNFECKFAKKFVQITEKVKSRNFKNNPVFVNFQIGNLKMSGNLNLDKTSLLTLR